MGEASVPNPHYSLSLNVKSLLSLFLELPVRCIIIKGVGTCPLKIVKTGRVPVHVKVLQGESVPVVINGRHQLPGDEAGLVLVTRADGGQQLTRGEEPGPGRGSCTSCVNM